jgi:molybdopterin molybdotransferase
VPEKGAPLSNRQIITHLAPLADVFAAIDRQVKAVPPRETDVASALGRVLAEDARAAGAVPVRPLALRDGYALQAECTGDAGAYAPLILRPIPPRVDAGDPLPEGADAVVPREAVIEHAAHIEVTAPVAFGENVIAAGMDAAPDAVLRAAGQRLRPRDRATLTLCAVHSVAIRAPRIAMAPARNTPMHAAAMDLIADMLQTSGADVVRAHDLTEAFHLAAIDGIVTIGGTGSGRHDESVEKLRAMASNSLHGIGLCPGETTALGFRDGCPILMLPGRIDAALAAGLVVGGRMIARLTGAGEERPAARLPLARKVTSTIGMGDVVLVACEGGAAVPLASRHWPLQALARAGGWIFVPPESEGWPAGTVVDIHRLP